MSRSGIECAECTSLWRELAAATRTHVDLLKEQQRAALADPERVETIDRELEIAAAKRDAARTAVNIHLAAEHSEPGTMAAG